MTLPNLRVQLLLASSFLVVALGMMAAEVVGAPFLLSDPWLDSTKQPDSCTAAEPGTANRTLNLQTDNAGRKYIHEDLANTPDGSHTWTIICKKEGLLDSDPLSFGFVLPLPQVPSPDGLRLVP